MIQDYPASGMPAWRLVVQESLSLLAGGLLYPFGIGHCDEQTARRRDQRTVVLVHGYLANRSTFYPLMAYLRLRAIRQVLSFNYDSTAGIEHGAVALRDFLRRHVRGGRIDLVCHSLGGLVARFYLQELGGARRVDRCMTLGTPHHGTYNSYWVPSRVGAELRPDSAILARLRQSQPQASGVRFLSVIAGCDSLVVPRVFAKHDRAVHMANVGHMSMLFSPRILALVADFLTLEASSADSSTPGAAPGTRPG